MADFVQEIHRPGALNQPNKAHKQGRHRSKRQQRNSTSGGRVTVQCLRRVHKKEIGKELRRQQTNLRRKLKNEAVKINKLSLGGATSPPFLIGVLPLSETVCVQRFLDTIKECDETATVTCSDMGIVHVSIPRFRQRFSFLTAEYSDLYGSLDLAKIVDSMILLVSVQDGIDEIGDWILNSIMSQSLPTTNTVATNFENLNPKKAKEAKKLLQKEIEKKLPDEKVSQVDSAQDAIAFLRTLGSQKIVTTTLKKQRPHIVAESIGYQLDNTETNTGTLKVSGYVRGPALDVNGLVHLPGFGDFQLSQIESPVDPHSLVLKNNNKRMDAEGVHVLFRADPAKQESLESEANVDPMDAEQTWPTEEEIAEAEKDCPVKDVRRVPKGTSSYQAAWIGDSDGEEVDSEDDDDEMMEDADLEAVNEDEENDEESDGLEEDLEEVELENEATNYDETIDSAEEKALLERLKEAKSHQDFPDEVDTPQDIPARERFQKYRGLRSYRTSPWDPNENLPADYARIFKFHNFVHTCKKIKKMELTEGAQHGLYVTIHIKEVPKEFIDTFDSSQPLTVFGLLSNEHKMSVLHIVLKRNPDYEHPIKAKERMIFHVGPRKFSACPIYSQHTNANKHKYERFFQPNSTVVATIFAPITYPPISALMFKPMPDGSHALVASGSVLSVNPNRIITKRTVLSGHPYKINKKHAVIRFMFFDPEDINWFKPVELQTKMGRTGHIMASLGTHGHMKCFFDEQLNSMDIVLLLLYKRVFPKWTYSERLTPPNVKETENNDEEEMME